MDYTIEQINMAFNNLLEAKSNAMIEMDIKNVVHDILEGYSLIEDKRTVINNAIYYVLIGLAQKRDFESFLQKDLGFDISLSRKMILEIEEKIFQPIEDKINEYLSEKESLIDLEDEKNKDISIINTSEISKNTTAPLGAETILESRVIDIGKRHKLSIDQIGELVEITNLVISGEIYASQYRGRLKERIDINQETFEKIIIDINEEILKDIRKKMMEEKGENTIWSEKDIPLPPYASLPSSRYSFPVKNDFSTKNQSINTNPIKQTKDTSLLEKNTQEDNNKIEVAKLELPKKEEEDKTEKETQNNIDKKENDHSFFKASLLSVPPKTETGIQPVIPIKISKDNSLPENIIPLAEEKKENNNVFNNSGIEIPLTKEETPIIEEKKEVTEPKNTNIDPIFSQNNSIYTDLGVEIISDNKKDPNDSY